VDRRKDSLEPAWDLAAHPGASDERWEMTANPPMPDRGFRFPLKPDT